MTLEPVAYWKLKSELLLVSLQEQQLLNQKAAFFAEHGLPLAPYVFNDEACEVVRQDEVSVVRPS